QDIARGEIVKLSASGGIKYHWSNAAGIIEGQDSPELTIRPVQGATYTVTAENANGCSVAQSITIQVREDYRNVIPNNMLSPNGDGVNDKWLISNIDMYPDNEVRIFDRAGRLIYHKKGYANEWDATLNGSPLTEDTYYYILDFGSMMNRKKGFIT